MSVIGFELSAGCRVGHAHSCRSSGLLSHFFTPFVLGGGRVGSVRPLYRDHAFCICLLRLVSTPALAPGASAGVTSSTL